MTGLQVGMARVNITPAIGFGDMYGYAARKECNRRPRGILDPLYVKAFVVSDGERCAALVSIDVGNIDRGIAESVRSLAAGLTPIPAEHIMVCGTHTHASVGITICSPFPIDEHFREDVIRKAAGAIYSAWLQLEPAKLGAGYGKVPHLMSEAAIARRDGDPFSWGYDAAPNEPIMANKVFRGEPFFPLSDVNKDTDYGRTPVDATVGVIRLDAAGGRPLGVLYSFGCHPDVLGPNNVLLSADFPGYASALIEREMGDDGIAVYCQGAGGDIRMVLTCSRQEWTAAETERDLAVHNDLKRIGGILGKEVVRAWRNIPTDDAARVSVHRDVVRCPYWKLPTVRELEIYRDTQEKELALAMAGRPTTPYPATGTNYNVNVAKKRLDWARRCLAGYCEKRIDPAGFEMEIQTLQIGPALIVGLPMEVFALTSLKLKEAFPDRTVILCSNANNNLGYLLPRGCHEEGGYWVETSPMWYGMPSFNAPEGEEQARAAAVRLVCGSSQRGEKRP